MIDKELISQFLSAYFPQAPQTLPGTWTGMGNCWWSGMRK